MLQIKQYPSQEAYKKSLHALCDKLVKQHAGNRPLPLTAVTNIVQASLALHDIRLCNRALHAFRFVEHRTLAIIGSYILQTPVSFSVFQAALAPCLSIFASPDKQMRLLGCLLAASTTGTVTRQTMSQGLESGMSAWVLSRIDNMWMRVASRSIELGSSDVGAIALCLSLYDKNKFDTLVSPLVKRHTQNTTFKIRLLNHIYESVQSDTTSRAPSNRFFHALLPSTCAHFNLATTPPLRGAELAAFFDHCTSLNHTPSVQRMLLSLPRQSRLAPAAAIPPLYIACLQELQWLLPKWGVPWTDAFYRQLFQSLLDIYVVRCVGMEPAADDEASEEEVKRWRQRKGDADAVFAGFHLDHLCALLGERYVDIVQMRRARLATARLYQGDGAGRGRGALARCGLVREIRRLWLGRV
ncbi:hypothetical protein BDV95DRAFT_62683 [Massariosphaeria phaeospora]|uniref:Uncharacterized protein n=1 Tax=Massariosphaeria phaeospora TaxID=100035 RepID=A0A7C8I4B3_9PLEO|nr:hypothetical protein BDV95DRAFT_62683 [Massariosphaeria phaeospora]